MGALGPDVDVPQTRDSATICSPLLEKFTHMVGASDKDMAAWVVLPRTLDGQPRNMTVDPQVNRDMDPAISSALPASRSKRRCQRRRKEHP
jgi:hypothetical protein